MTPPARHHYYADCRCAPCRPIARRLLTLCRRCRAADAAWRYAAAARCRRALMLIVSAIVYFAIDGCRHAAAAADAIFAERLMPLFCRRR